MTTTDDPGNGSDGVQPNGHYPTDAPDHLVTTDGAWLLKFHTDGTVEVRHNGRHDRWL